MLKFVCLSFGRLAFSGVSEQIRNKELANILSFLMQPGLRSGLVILKIPLKKYLFFFINNLRLKEKKR